MYRLILLSILIPIFTTSLSIAQPEILESLTFGGDGVDRANAIVAVEDGGYLLAGETYSIGEGVADWWVVRTDSAGEEIWSENYGSDTRDICRDAIQTADGNFALAGSWGGREEGNVANFGLVVIDDEGEVQLSANFGDAWHYECFFIDETDSGNFVLIGEINHNRTDRDYWIMCCDNEGELLWSNEFGGDGSDLPMCAAATDDGGYIIGGNSQSFGGNNRDGWMVKTDDEGEEEWTQLIDTDGVDDITSIIQTEDGGYLYTYRDRVVKTDEEGEEEWNEMRESEGLSHAVIEGAGGGYVFTGIMGIRDGDEVDFNMFYEKSDEEGEILWWDHAGSEELQDWSFDIVTNEYGGYAISGYYSQDLRDMDFWLIITEPDPDYEPFGWFDLPTIEFSEDEEFAFSFDSLMTYYVGPDSIEVEFVPGEFVSAGLENENLVFSSVKNRYGDDSVQFVALLDGEDIAASFLHCTVLPVNDLPDTFSLVSPDDESVISSWVADFRWEAAIQNEWELDTVSYNIEFSTEEEGYEGDYTLEGIADTAYLNLEMETLVEWMGLNLGWQAYDIEWRVEAVDDSGSTRSTEVFSFTIPVESVEENRPEGVPSELILFPAYPNPFNSTTSIRFGLPAKSNVQLKIFDQNGSLIATLLSGIQQPGFHKADIKARSFPTGIYFINLTAGKKSLAEKIVLIK